MRLGGRVWSGKPLEEIVARLKEVGKESAEIEEKKKLLAARKAQIRAMQQEGGLKTLKDEEKALEAELVAMGALVPKKKGKPQKEQGPAEPTLRLADTPGASGGNEEEPEDAEVSDVRDNLASALDYLDDALTGDWPDIQDANELNAILVAAQDCETKLAEITVKAKELLADIDVEPEAVPSGDH